LSSSGDSLWDWQRLNLKKKKKIREAASYKLITYIKQVEGIDELVVDLYWSVAGGELKKIVQ